MQLSHMSDRPLDLKTQIQDLTRNTTDILLLEIPMIDNSNELYFDVKRNGILAFRHRPSHGAGKERWVQRLAPSLTPLLSTYAR